MRRVAIQLFPSKFDNIMPLLCQQHQLKTNEPINVEIKIPKFENSYVLKYANEPQLGKQGWVLQVPSDKEVTLATCEIELTMK